MNAFQQESEEDSVKNNWPVVKPYSPEDIKAKSVRGGYPSLRDALGEEVSNLFDAVKPVKTAPENEPEAAELLRWWGDGTIRPLPPPNQKIVEKVSFPSGYTLSPDERGNLIIAPKEYLLQKTIEPDINITLLVECAGEPQNGGFAFIVKKMIVGGKGIKECIDFAERISLGIDGPQTEIKIYTRQAQSPVQKGNTIFAPPKFYYSPYLHQVAIGELNNFDNFMSLLHELGHVANEGSLDEKARGQLRKARSARVEGDLLFYERKIDELEELGRKFGISYTEARRIVAEKEFIASSFALGEAKLLSEILGLDEKTLEYAKSYFETLAQSYDSPFIVAPEISASRLGESISPEWVKVIKEYCRNYQDTISMILRHEGLPGNAFIIEVGYSPHERQGKYIISRHGGLIKCQWFPSINSDPKTKLDFYPEGATMEIFTATKDRKLSFSFDNPQAVIDSDEKDANTIISMLAELWDKLARTIFEREEEAIKKIGILKTIFGPHFDENDPGNKIPDTPSFLALKRLAIILNSINFSLVDHFELNQNLLLANYNPDSGKPILNEEDRLIMICERIAGKQNGGEDILRGQELIGEVARLLG